MTNLDHVGVYVKDLAKSLSFYGQVFGWKITREFGSGEAKIVVVDVGSGLLELIQRPGSPGKAPEGNWSHLALHVDDWEGKVRKLEGIGVELRKVTMPDSSHIAFFKDPDGHMIEIMERGLGKSA
jgi:catechol 2,3-dioxygenase-like lactoylglutathione lyase family enzyme